MTRLRQGRHNKQLVYVQTGTEPSDSDELFAVFFSAHDAAAVVGWSEWFRSLPGRGKEAK